jgi:hypothetical protein
MRGGRWQHLLDEIVGQVDLDGISRNRPASPRPLDEVFDDLPDAGSAVLLGPRNIKAVTDKRQGILIVDGKEYYLGSGQGDRVQTPTVGGRTFTEGIVYRAMEIVANARGFRNPTAVRTAVGNGFENKQASHVEHQAAMVLRRIEQVTGTRIKAARLLMNELPCGGVQGCGPNLSRMLPDGTVLEVWVGSRSDKPLQPLPPFTGVADE